MVTFDSQKSNAEHPKPTMGETSSTSKTFPACPQSTPEVPPVALDMSWLASPTPMMEPVMVWVLEAGRPSHQVPRFHRMAAISNAKTMANPAPELTFRISSTGSSVMMVKATVPGELSTPARLHSPDQTTAMLGSKEWV